MLITTDGKWKTRDGSPAKILCVDADRWGLPYPVVAIVDSKVWMYTAHGRVPLCRREVRANLVPDNSK